MRKESTLWDSVSLVRRVHQKVGEDHTVVSKLKALSSISIDPIVVTLSDRGVYCDGRANQDSCYMS